jgi:hypothetical protein
VKLVEKLGLPELTTEQIEALCSTAENAARKHVLAKVSPKMIEKLNISVEADGANGAKPVNLTVEIDMALSPQMKGFDLDKLAGEAVEQALKASENYLRKII